MTLELVETGSEPYTAAFDGETSTESTPTTEVLEGDVEEVIDGTYVAPTYGFESRLEMAINEGIGDTTTDNPGLVVVTEFTRWLGEHGIGPELFGALRSEQTNAMAATATESSN
jgi:hypothetical protein